VSAPRTVRVRIAVAVTESGCWEAIGYEGSGYSWVADRARSKFLPGVPLVVHFVEADLPLPASETVDGKVTPARRRFKTEVSRDGQNWMLIGEFEEGGASSSFSTDPDLWPHQRTVEIK